MKEYADIVLILCERLGFPAAFCLCMLAMFAVVCKFFAPLIRDWHNDYRAMLATFSANDTKSATALEMIAQQGTVGHKTTHEKLDGLSKDVHDVKADVKVIRTKLYPRAE